jgi:hypothetical protein
MTYADPAAPSPNAAYALGWFVDHYNGRARISHTGYLHDVHSSVMLFPEDDLAMVSFTNFGGPRLASLINQTAFDVLMGFKPAQTIEEKLSEYEKKIEETRVRNTSARRVDDTSPSHSLDDYAGTYEHAGYGRIEIHCKGGVLSLERNTLALPLERWHYDSWTVKDNDLFGIEAPHVFDRASRLIFEMNVDGDISSVLIRFEPTVGPIRFERRQKMSIIPRSTRL